VKVDLMMGKDHQHALRSVYYNAALITTMDFLTSEDFQEIKVKIKEIINWIGSSSTKTLIFDDDQAFK
jgi:IS30 family transposase